MRRGRRRSWSPMRSRRPRRRPPRPAASKIAPPRCQKRTELSKVPVMNQSRRPSWGGRSRAARRPSVAAGEHRRHGLVARACPSFARPLAPREPALGLVDHREEVLRAVVVEVDMAIRQILELGCGRRSGAKGVGVRLNSSNPPSPARDEQRAARVEHVLERHREVGEASRLTGDGDLHGGPRAHGRELARRVEAATAKFAPHAPPVGEHQVVDAVAVEVRGPPRAGPPGTLLGGRLKRPPPRPRTPATAPARQAFVRRSGCPSPSRSPSARLLRRGARSSAGNTSGVDSEAPLGPWLGAWVPSPAASVRGARRTTRSPAHWGASSHLANTNRRATPGTPDQPQRRSLWLAARAPSTPQRWGRPRDRENWPPRPSRLSSGVIPR